MVSFKNQNPARGRKRKNEGFNSVCKYVFKNQNPARGRKRVELVADTICAVVDLRTRTPQGDGNSSRLNRMLTRLIIFKNQNPARGRKRISKFGFLSFISLFKNQNPARGRKPDEKIPHPIHFQHHLRTRTPQGDGNMHDVPRIRNGIAIFKNQNPARGRKLL